MRPSSRAPTNSKTAAMMTAWCMVRVLLPTEVAKALATTMTLAYYLQGVHVQKGEENSSRSAVIHGSDSAQ
jgi:hypothetical protein